LQTYILLVDVDSLVIAYENNNKKENK